MSIRSLSSVILLWACGTVSYAQGAFQKDIAFLQHLGQIGQYKEATHYIDQVFVKYSEQLRRDSLSYLKGRYLYEQKELAGSIQAFGAVSPRMHKMWEESRFFMAFQHAYSHRYDSALSILQRTEVDDPLRRELKAFQTASTYLLMRDFEAFEESTRLFTYEYYQLADYEKDMIGISGELKARKHKSAFVAGLLSAVMPGAGKYYQGKIGQGTTALVGTGVMGLQAYEGFRKDGPGSARFIIFGSLFSVFYIANIWGSAVSVRVNEVRYNETVDEAIFINMHLPVRLLFR